MQLVTASIPSYVPKAIQELDWLHEVVGTLASESPEYLDVDELELGTNYAREAVDLLEQAGQVDGVDTTAAAQAARGAGELVSTALDLLRTSPEPSAEAMRFAELGEQAEALVHEAFQALGTDRD